MKKYITVNEKLHKRFQRYCAKNNISMKEKTESLLTIFLKTLKRK